MKDLFKIKLPLFLKINEVVSLSLYFIVNKWIISSEIKAQM